MAVKFFGQFLLEKTVVSRETLLKAIELQESVNLKFGETALTAQIISPADLDRIHDAQRSVDLKFGDMAVKLGIMTNEQVTQVLTLQKNSHVYIGEALVKVGGLSSEDIQRYLEEFKVDQAPYATDRVAIPPGLLHPEIWEAFADLTQKMLTRVVGISCRLGKCRLDDHLQGSDVTAAMDLSGDVTARVILSVSTNIQEKIAGAILKEENLAGESTEVLNDTVMEFLNIVCGNLAAKVAQLGKNLEILPPLIIQSENNLIAVPVGSQGLLFDLHPAGHEKIEIAVFVQR